MTATIIPFPTRPPQAPLPGTWVHDLVRHRPMQVVAAQISQGRPINYTLFDPAFGLDVFRTPDQVQFLGHGAAPPGAA